MAFASWLRSLNHRFQHVPAKRSRRRAARRRSTADKLCVERLEDRTLLSARIIEVPVPTTTNLPPTHSSAPRAITVGPDGNLWFSEFEAQKVGRITPDGHIDEFATQFPHPDQIIAVPGGNLWVVENGTDDYLRPIVGGIPTDPKIEVITPSGAHVTSFNAPPYTNGAGMTIGADGNVWFGEYWDNKIDRITPDGHIDQFTVSFPLVGVTTEADGTSWILYKSNVIGRVRLDGSGAPPVDYTIPGAADYGLRGIAIGRDGNLWMGGLRTHQIFQVSKQGQVLNTYSTVFSPFSMALGADGALWFSENDGTDFENSRIGRITIDGTMTEYPTPTPGSFTGEIVAGPDGNLWFSELDGNKIGKVIFNDQTPIADAGGPYTIHEGDSLSLDASASHYPGGGSLTYVWDIEGPNGVVHATGVRPTVSRFDLYVIGLDDGPATFTVRVWADGVASPPVNGTLLNTAPTPVFGAPPTSPEGTTILLYGGATDPSIADANAGFTFNWTATKNGNPFASQSFYGL